MVVESWRVFGRIGGEKLPTSVVRIADIYVGPLPAGTPSVERAQIESAAPHQRPSYVAQIADLRVYSDCYFWVDVKAANVQAAMDYVSANQVPLLQACLSLRSESVPCHTELVWLASQGLV